MAKIVITADTKENTLDVKLNGESLEDVNGVSVYVGSYDDPDKISCSISMSDNSQSEDYRKSTYISTASAKKEDGVEIIRGDLEELAINTLLNSKK